MIVKYIEIRILTRIACMTLVTIAATLCIVYKNYCVLSFPSHYTMKAAESFHRSQAIHAKILIGDVGNISTDNTIITTTTTTDRLPCNTLAPGSSEAQPSTPPFYADREKRVAPHNTTEHTPPRAEWFTHNPLYTSAV